MGVERAPVACAHSKLGPAGRAGFGHRRERIRLQYQPPVGTFGFQPGDRLFRRVRAILALLRLQRRCDRRPVCVAASAAVRREVAARARLERDSHRRSSRHSQSALARDARARRGLLPVRERFVGASPPGRAPCAGRPEVYGAMLSAVALGAIVGSLTFVSLRRPFGLDPVVVLGMVLMSVALLLFGSSRSVIVLLAASVVAGFAGTSCWRASTSRPSRSCRTGCAHAGWPHSSSSAS